MAGSLSASLGAAAAWSMMVLVLSGLGIALGSAWRAWGSRSPIAERLRSLLMRGNDGDPSDLDEDEATQPEADATTSRQAARPATGHVPIHASEAERDEEEALRAEGWLSVDDLDESGEVQVTADAWGADAWAEWDDATDVLPPELQGLSASPGPGASEASDAVPAEGHPNDALYDVPDEPAVDPARGTRVIPIVPPSRAAHTEERHEKSPWSFEEEREMSVPDAVGGSRLASEEDNPFAEGPDGSVEDEVDRLLENGRRVVPVHAPEVATPSAPQRPEDTTRSVEEEETAKETAALSTLPDGHLRPPEVSPLDPDRGRERRSLKAERRPFATQDDPGAARKGSVVATPKKRELSRAEAIEELTAIYAISYEEACSLLDAGLWGFENHEEWIRAVRASGRPACVEDATFEKVMSMPMKAIRDDLDRLREKRRATQELEQLWGVGADEASALYEAGFTTVEQIREASVDQLARIKQISHSTAFMIKAAAHGLAPDTT